MPRSVSPSFSPMKSPMEKPATPSRWKRNLRGDDGRWQRIEDGLGLLSPQARYRLRCRMEGRCPDCGKSVEPERKTVRCKACTDTRSARTRRANAMRLWLDGASEEHVARLCIGKVNTRRDRRRANPFAFRCARCDAEQMCHWHGQEGCRVCGAPIWPPGMALVVRRRWMKQTDEQRARNAIG